MSKVFSVNLYKSLAKRRNDRSHDNSWDMLKEDYPDLKSGCTLITKCGDWGIKRSDEVNIRGRRQPVYRIEDATHGGAFIPLEIKSIKHNTKRWFTTNLYQYLGKKVYPLPLGINGDMDSFIEAKNEVSKDSLCCANFSITSPYRIRVAEWAIANCDKLDISCHFFERYRGQKEDLKMPFLHHSGLEVQDFKTNLARHQFCICPKGNGLDTFRMWECILTNTVPIVQDSWMTRVFSKIWPMIIISRYENCNLTLLMDSFFEKYGSISYDTDLLKEEYFKNLLDRIRYESDRLRRKRV